MAQPPRHGETIAVNCNLYYVFKVTVKPNFVSTDKPLFKPSARWLIFGIMAAALAVSGVTMNYVSRFRRSAAADLANHNLERIAISALGYLRPEGDVVDLSAPVLPNGMGSRVAQLLVEEGKWVKEGDIVAVLDNYESLQAVVKQAERRVEVSQANLAQVQAGAKTGELDAQRATIARLQADLQGQLNAQDQIIARLAAELQNAQTEYARFQSLFQEGATTASQLDNKQLAMITAQEQWNEAQADRRRIETTFREQINAAQATFSQIAEVRPTDVQAAQAEVQSAIADVAKAKADLNLAYVRAPRAGQILKIYSRPGEGVSDRGIVALGGTQQMNVMTEVYESDVGNVRVGQFATITSEAFPGTLQGKVVQVGFQVNSQGVISTDPVADVDQRVVDVKIQLNSNDSKRVASFTNLQVNVVIHLNSTSTQ
ncbi:ABC exporter membrane fusion protein [Leptolyngbya sp. FACHB-16]|uniref:ABC exporter membrane fusion protein n=1 Tax=unclassified Leptolyngbya TaxID=2650499 RepID=UPI0016863505|nr:ABC exporter membrane fusion protein [Leptolyngbya sp. FACHB-16]MBD2153041.1 ABC exporter membrane fusion protein [Leptolyngbya sp. FACHB-16]